MKVPLTLALAFCLATSLCAFLLGTLVADSKVDGGRVSTVLAVTEEEGEEEQQQQQKQQLTTRPQSEEEVGDFSSVLGEFTSEGYLTIKSFCNDAQYKVYGEPFRAYKKRVKLDSSCLYVWVQCNGEINLLVRMPMPTRSAPRPNNNGTRLPPNIQTFLFDALSRDHMLRSMPETVQLLRRGASKLGYSVFDFEKMHALGTYSIINKAPLYLGRHIAMSRKARTTGWIWDRLRDKLGYESMYAGATYMCTPDGTPDGYSSNLVQFYFKNLSQIDHIFPPSIACENRDVPALKPGNKCPHTSPQYEFRATLPMCAGHKPMISHFSDYLDRFNRQYRKFPKISSVEMFETHEKTMRLSYVIDKTFAATLRRQLVHGADDTLFFVMGDHGMHLGKYAATDAGLLETLTPPLFVLIPNSLLSSNRAARQSLTANTRAIVTHFDIYNSILKIPSVFGGNADLSDGVSLFDPLPPDRSCDDAGIPLRQCVYVEWKPLADTSLEKTLIAYALRHMNNKLQKQQQQKGQQLQVCAPLVLHSVVRVMVKRGSGSTHESTAYLVEFRTRSSGRPADQLPMFRVVLSCPQQRQCVDNVAAINVHSVRQLTAYVQYIQSCIADIKKVFTPSEGH